MEYAVRGPILTRAGEIEKELLNVGPIMYLFIAVVLLKINIRRAGVFFK